MSIFGGVQVVTIICSVARTKAIALWLGATGVGLSAIFYTVFTLISSISQLGIRNSAVRDISQAGTPERLQLTALVVRRCCVWLGIAGAAVMLLASPLLSHWYFGSGSMTIWFAMMAPMILLMNMAIGESALLQGAGRLKRLANTSIWTAVGGTLLCLPLYLLMGNDSVVPAICTFALINWVGVHIWRMRTPRPEPMPDNPTIWRLGRGFISLGIYMTLSELISQAVSLLFISYLQNTGGIEHVGYFQAGFTLVNQYVGLIFTAISMEYYPRLAAAIHSRRATQLFVSHEIKLVLWTLVGPATLFIAANTMVIAILYEASFAIITPFIVWATVGTVFRAVSWCVAIVILARGDGRTYIVTESISALVYLVVNVLMYRAGGIAGMGFAYILWFMLYTVNVSIVYRLRYGCRLSASARWTTAGITAGIALCAVCYLYVSIVAAWLIAATAATATIVALRRMYRR